MSIREAALLIHRHYKLFVGVTVIVLAFLLLFIGVSNSDNKVNASTHNEKYFKCINVSEDDTLWSIAEANISEEYTSIEDYIDEVKSINGLYSDKIYSGATLVVPYYSAPQ